MIKTCINLWHFLHWVRGFRSANGTPLWQHGGESLCFLHPKFVNPTLFVFLKRHSMKQTKKASGSYPIQFTWTHRKCQKNMINCGGPFFSRFSCFPGDASKLPTFPFHAHLATACCQHCQSPRHGPAATATFAVLVAGFEAKTTITYPHRLSRLVG